MAIGYKNIFTFAALHNDCKGSPNITQDEINGLFLQCYKNNVQVFTHCNGDAATDMVIKYIKVIETVKEGAVV